MRLVDYTTSSILLIAGCSWLAPTDAAQRLTVDLPVLKVEIDWSKGSLLSPSVVAAAIIALAVCLIGLSLIRVISRNNKK